MEIANQNFVGFLDWKVKTTDLKVKIRDLESRELDDVAMYYSIMQNICLQFGGLVAVSSLIGGLFREFNYFVVVSMILAYFLYIAHPLYFGKKNMQALKRSSCGVIYERRRLHRACIRLLAEYNHLCAVASPFKDAQDLFFKKIGDVDMKEFKNFKRQNADYMYKTKYYQKCLLLVGILGLIYLVWFISALYLVFQDVPKVSLGFPYQAK